MVHVWEYRPICPRHARGYRLAARQSVHCVPVMDVALGRIKRQGYVKERSETRIALALEVYHSAAHRDVDDSPNNEWSDRGLQVFDLKAAAALSCSYTIGTDHAGSHTITVARTCMHHAPSRGCCREPPWRSANDGKQT